MNQEKIILILILTLSIFFGVSALIWNTDIKYSEDDPGLNRTYWSKVIDRVGESSAYDRFKQKNKNIENNSQHLASHVFGELLFEKIGVEGISVCDASFGFGCYHGFFTRAVSENGLPIIKELDDACVFAYTSLGTGCQHGIGHGIMEYFGYEDIELALDACKETTQLTPLLGCSSGVFMEYRTPLLYGDDFIDIVPREFNEENPYDPCERIVGKYRPSCFFELAGWWSGVLHGSYERMGNLCGDLYEEDRKNCFLGVGTKIATQEEYNVQEIIGYCKDFEKGNDERDCLSGASWSFFSDPEHRDKAPSLCSGLNIYDRTVCIKNADLTQGLDDNHL